MDGRVGEETDVDSKAIGLALKLAREGKGLTQSQVSKDLKLSPQQVSVIEHGRFGAGLRNVGKLADRVGLQLVVSLQEVTSREDDESQVWELLDSMSPAERVQAITVLRAIVGMDPRELRMLAAQAQISMDSRPKE